MALVTTHKHSLSYTIGYHTISAMEPCELDTDLMYPRKHNRCDETMKIRHPPLCTLRCCRSSPGEWLRQARGAREPSG
jgi:hypothetical protein